MQLFLLSVLLVLGGPKLKVDDHRHDFGERAEKSKIEHAFVFENVGDAPLIISDHSVSCHCTTVLYPGEPILPGKSVKVLVRYDATKVGKFNRKIIVYTNAGKEQLVIKGEVVKSEKKINPLTGEPKD